MTRKKLTDAIAAVAERCGFAFQTGFAYRIALGLGRLPAAWLHPPVLTRTQGRREGFKTYSAEMELIEKYGGNEAAAKEEQWDSLEAQAARICSLLGECAEIREVSNIALAPAELSLTAQGELSLNLKFEVTMPFCEYCDGSRNPNKL